MCLSEGKITPAIDVHHKDSFTNYTGNMRLYKAFDYSNLLSVCKECHSKLHRNGTTHG
jgi:5-methylcytosine-specific restriction protein A